MAEQIGKTLGSFFDTLKKSKKIILLMVIVAVVSIGGTSLISIMLSRTQNIYVPSLGFIKTIEVEAYSDANCNNLMEQIEWDQITPGESTVNTLYIKSVSNFEIVLTIDIREWSPAEMADYITITTDYDGQRLSPGEIIQIQMSLSTVDSKEFKEYLVENEVQQFSVDIHFIGVE
ncbi:MAG: hypothetical protein NWF03_06455 [Candidatus Bathyarchaeota archaeon]|nr:hypothetical protein [Candidatus Bathyarchaeota archaeon]